MSREDVGAAQVSFSFQGGSSVVASKPPGQQDISKTGATAPRFPGLAWGAGSRNGGPLEEQGEAALPERLEGLARFPRQIFRSREANPKSLRLKLSTL